MFGYCRLHCRTIGHFVTSRLFWHKIESKIFFSAHTVFHNVKEYGLPALRNLLCP